MDSKALKEVGLKVTLPRMKILNILQDHADLHLKAEDIYKQLINEGEAISLATVYRVLTQFEAAGLVVRHNFEGGQSVFERNLGNHHDHIVCLDCGHIEEFVDETIEKRQRAVTKKFNFTLAEHSLILYAHCNQKECPFRVKR